MDTLFPMTQEQALRVAWLKYQARPAFDSFVEFSSLLNHLTDSLQKTSQAGLLYVCRQLEQKALALFGDETSHPIPDKDMEEMGNMVVRMCQLMGYYVRYSSRQQHDRRAVGHAPAENPAEDDQDDAAQPQPEAQVEAAPEGAETGRSKTGITTIDIQNREIVLLGGEEAGWRDLIVQLGYFGIKARQGEWRIPDADDTDLSIYLVNMVDQPEERLDFLRILRERRSMALIVCMNTVDDFVFIHRALLSGVDHYLLADKGALPKILGLVIGHQNAIEESYRVLVVEDSKTAAYAIQRSLESHGFVVSMLDKPVQVLQVIRSFQPDLILMDMYMPYCTGVEAVRVIRQHDEFLSIPVIYLSGETNVGLQVEALRLGGDQFLTKPHNPVLMNAVIKSKIDRYRALRRSMQNDSLTGLLNHISSKQALVDALKKLPEGYCLDVVMLDIDKFKQVNDTHGHPVGDQVIRSLAWLLKQRLRQSDIVGRYGGEEFVLGLVGKIPGGARESLEHIREDFHRISFIGANEAPFTSSFSGGLASFRKGEDERLEPLLERADRALYQAKEQGRNQIVVAS